MKLILDECIDRRLTKEFMGDEIKTVPQMGWMGTKNGKLLALIEKEFDVFINMFLLMLIGIYIFSKIYLNSISL
jgi:hypothetical protein